MTKTIIKKETGDKMGEIRDVMIATFAELKETIIEDKLPTCLFQEGIDYEIISMGTKDSNNKELIVYPLDDLIGKSSQLFFEENNISSNFYERTLSILGKQYKELSPTPTVTSDFFYLINDGSPIDFDAALTFGLGVVKVLMGEYRGRYMFYNYAPLIEEELETIDIPFLNLYNETLMLLMYSQFTNPDKIDGEHLMFKVSENWYTDSLILRKRKEVYGLFSEILMPKKDETNLIEFNLF